MTLESHDMIRLLQEGESDRVEFKSVLSGNTRNEIQEAICAFSNDLPDHREPGVIFVGVHDDGSIAGLPITDELLRQLAGMRTEGNIVPPPSMTVEKLLLDCGDVAAVTVQPSDSLPVRYRGRVHVRVGPRRGTATAQDERVLNEKRRYRDIPFDIHPIQSATLSDLNLLQFELEYLPQSVDRETLEANNRSVEERLAAMKMIASIDNPVPTILGMLVLGEPTVLYLPGAYIQFLRFSGNDITDPISDELAIKGTVSDMLRRLDDKLNAHNRTAVDITSGALERRVCTYPVTAIQQIVRNAVMHRSYEGTNSPTRVYWYDDRIEVISPGGVFGSVTVENFGQPGITAYRNPNLAEAMRNMGFVQRYGIGIPLAERLLKEAGHPPMKFRVDMNFVIVSIESASD